MYVLHMYILINIYKNVVLCTYIHIYSSCILGCNGFQYTVGSKVFYLSGE